MKVYLKINYTEAKKCPINNIASGNLPSSTLENKPGNVIVSYVLIQQRGPRHVDHTSQWIRQETVPVPTDFLAAFCIFIMSYQ